ncbi:MAG: hypothetical protein JRI68_15150 [Deltaproteobacteria bacterium]|nr:hypothetical protein [Deltaproteobacteria bacterium]
MGAKTIVTIGFIALGAVVLTTQSCTLDFEVYEQPGAGGGSSTSSGGGSGAAGGLGGTTGTGGTGGGDGGSGGAPCGLEPTPPGGSCPSECTGGCANETCTIECNDDEECRDEQLTCPPDFNCVLDCSGAEGCRNATLACPEDYTCVVNCSGDNGCRDLEITCSTVGTCAVSCGSAHDACRGTDLLCGSNSCTATCDNSNRQPDVTCGPSCACNDNC